MFDSGWEDWAPVWAIVQPAVAKWTRACSYDRAGAGFSDAGPMPRTSVRIADELHGALHKAGVKGPYILVGHAFGGDNVRTFAVRFMEETAGLVLVEADVENGPDEHTGEAMNHRPASRVPRRNRRRQAAASPAPAYGPTDAHVRPAVLSRAAGGSVVAGAQRQASGNRPDQGCDVRRIHFGNGANACG